MSSLNKDNVSFIGRHYSSSSSSSSSSRHRSRSSKKPMTKERWMKAAKEGSYHLQNGEKQEMTPQQRRYFFWRAEHPSSSVGASISSSSSSSSSSEMKIESSMSTTMIFEKEEEGRLTTNQFVFSKFQIVVREITFKDIFSPKKRHSKLFQPLTHLGLFHPHAFGEMLGCISFDPKSKVCTYCSTFPKQNKFLTVLLLNAMHQREPEIHYVNSKPLIEEILTTEPTKFFIGNKHISNNDGGDGVSKLHFHEYLTELHTSSFIGKSIGEFIKPTPHFLELKCKVGYYPRLAGGDHEVPHGVYLHPSNNFAISEPIFIPASRCDGTTVHTLRFQVTQPSIPPLVLLNVESYAKMMNTTNEMCINQSGYTNVSLVQLVLSIDTKISLPLFVPNSHVHEPKGTFTILCVSSNMQPKHPVERIPELLQAIQYSLNKTVEMTANYVKRNREFYASHPASSPSVQNVTLYNYVCKKGRVPGSMFDCFKPPAVNEKYFLNALSYCIIRRFPQTFSSPSSPSFSPSFSPSSKEEGETLKFWNDETIIQVADRVRLAMDMLCLFPNYCKYITDEVDYNVSGKKYNPEQVELMESFDCQTRIRDAGDCEDYTLESLCEAMSLKYQRDQFVSQQMKDICQIFDNFIFMSMLCGVSRSSMNNESSSSLSPSSGLGPEENELAGHECAIAIPNYIFFKALSRADTNHPILSLYSEKEKLAGKGEQIYVLEGTGNLYPEPRSQTSKYLTLAAVIENTFSAASLENNGTQFFYHPDRPDNFYKKIMTLVTPEFFLRGGHRGLEFLVCIEDPKRPGVFLRGVSFSDLLKIDEIPSIRIYEAPLIPLETFRESIRMNDDDFPPITLQPIDVSPEMRWVAQRLTIINKKKEPYPLDAYSAYSFQVRMDNMTPKKLESLVNDINKSQLNSLCFPEAIKLNTAEKTCVGGYTIMIF